MRSFSVVWVQLVLGILLKPASLMAVGVSVTLTPDQDSIITIAKIPYGGGADCDICVDEGGNLTCNLLQIVLSKPVATTIQFNCTEPWDDYEVKTEGRIDCTSDSCSPEAGTVQAVLLSEPFTQFRRSFLWTISGPDGTVLGLDFLGPGLEEGDNDAHCDDGYQYTVSKTDAEGAVQTQYYCRGGAVTHLDLPSKASVSVDFPRQGEVPPTVFNLAPQPKPVKKGRTMDVTPDPDTLVTISRDAAAVAECSVCLGAGPNPDCNTELILREALSTTIQFTCEKPEDIFKVEINRDFDYTADPSSSKAMSADSSLFPEFKRSFTWDMKVPSSRTFQLDFPSPGMTQIAPTESCPDEHTYSIITYQRFGLATIGTFCKNGTISQIQVLYKGRVSLSVPKNKKLDTPAIKVSVGLDTKMLAIVRPQLPRGQSYSDFFSANYVNGFPSNEMMGWEFVVPPKHNITVSFLGHTAPVCGSKAVEVRYEQEGKAPVVKSLTEEQPANLQGSFSLLLQNCDSARAASSPQLTLNFRVSVLRGGVPHLCAVNMQKEAGVTLNVENTNPYCEMSVDGTAQDKITVPPGAKSTLSFLDCPSEDLRLTVTKTLECPSIAGCSVSRTPLTIPTLEPCLPVPIHSAIWQLRVPEHGTVALESPTGKLRQSLPGDECPVGRFSLHVAESDGSPVGEFCSGGVIRKVLIHNNVTITALAASARMRRSAQESLFNVSFGPEIRESIVYHVNPSEANVQVPVLLGTPGWPRAMKPISAVSWIIQLPSQHRADLLFTNISQPKCKTQHTMIKVQTIGSEEEILSRREDEVLEDKLGVTASFYLNMSNCQPESGSFSALSKVMVEKKSKKLLGIILGVVGALLVLTAIVLAVVCVVTRKKKLAHRVSIYNPKGNLFHPGETSYKPDNGSHVYDAIDETMTYSHLIGDSGYNGAKTGGYSPFSGPVVDVQPPIIEVPENNKKEEFSTFLDPAESFGPPRPRTPLGPMKSLGFEDRRMVDTQLCTFKNSGGEPNPIRLSDPDPLPPPVLDDDWDHDYDNEDYL